MAITYGMSVKEFWEEDPDLFWAYRFSYFNKLKTEQEIFNNNAWLQGAYFTESVSVALNNAFSKQKIEYSKQPYGTEKKETNKQKQESNVLVAKINARVSQLQQMFKSKECSTTEKGTTQEGGEKINE